jgi:hypothetical protein
VATPEWEAPGWIRPAGGVVCDEAGAEDEPVVFAGEGFGEDVRDGVRGVVGVEGELVAAEGVCDGVGDVAGTEEGELASVAPLLE